MNKTFQPRLLTTTSPGETQDRSGKPRLNTSDIFLGLQPRSSTSAMFGPSPPHADGLDHWMRGSSKPVIHRASRPAQNQQAARVHLRNKPARSAYAYVSLATHAHQVGDRRPAGPGAGDAGERDPECASAQRRRRLGASASPRRSRLWDSQSPEPCTHVAVTALAPPGRRLQQDPKTAHWKEGIAER